MNVRESTPIKVGLFVFFGLFMAMVVIFLLGSEKQFFKRQYTLVTYFKDISGLRVGAQVQLAGLTVGMVELVSFEEDLKDKRIQVRMSVSKEFQERIRKDSAASISTQGLLGDKFISLSLGTPDQPVLQEGEILTSEEHASIYTVAEKFGTVIESVNKAAGSINKMLDEVNGGQGLLHTLVYESKERPIGANFAATSEDIKDASRELKQILEKINRGEGTVGAILQDPSLYYDIRRLFARVERSKILSHIIRSRIRDLEIEKIDAAPTNPDHNPR